MKLLGGSMFVPLAITIILCGLIVFYFKQKTDEQDMKIQGMLQVVQRLNSIQPNTTPQPATASAPSGPPAPSQFNMQMPAAAVKVEESNQDSAIRLIPVSDNEEAGSDDGSDDESDDGSDDGSDAGNDDGNNNDDKVIVANGGSGDIEDNVAHEDDCSDDSDISCTTDDNEVKHIQMDDTIAPLDVKEDITDDVIDLKPIKLEEPGDDNNELDNILLNMINNHNSGNDDTSKGPPAGNLDDLKVADLRAMIKERNINVPHLNRLKKGECLEILNKQN